MVQVTVGSGSYTREMYRLDRHGHVEKVTVSTDLYEIPDDGKYVLTCIGYGDVFELNGQYGIQEKIRLEFETDDAEPYIFDAMFTVGWGDRSQLRKTVEALLDRTLTKGEQLDFDDLLGKKMQVTLIGEESANGNVYAKFSKVAPVTEEVAKPRRRNTRQRDDDGLPEFPDGDF